MLLRGEHEPTVHGEVLEELLVDRAAQGGDRERSPRRSLEIADAEDRPARQRGLRSVTLRPPRTSASRSSKNPPGQPSTRSPSASTSRRPHERRSVLVQVHVEDREVGGVQHALAHAGAAAAARGSRNASRRAVVHPETTVSTNRCRRPRTAASGPGPPRAARPGRPGCDEQPLHDDRRTCPRSPTPRDRDQDRRVSAHVLRAEHRELARGDHDLVAVEACARGSPGRAGRTTR